MEQGRFGEHLAPAVVILLLSPVILVFVLLLALGSGFDLFQFGETPLALALCAPTLLVLLRYLSARAEAKTAEAPPASKLAVGRIHIPELP
jgi:hypothetical protein